MRLPSSRYRITAPVLSTVLIATTLITDPARAAAPPAPVLWEGVVHGDDGQPAEAEVVAYARPAGADLGTGNALVEIARTQTDGSGRYRLRSGHVDALRAVEDEDGWANVMVVAFGGDGDMSLAVDSVAWQPTGGSDGLRAASAAEDRGRWVTTPAERELAPGRTRAFRAAADQGEPPEAVAVERPAVMTLSPSGEMRVSAQGATVAPRIPMCAGPQKTKNMGVHPVDVGELHLNRDWTGKFEYRSTSSTSFQVGVHQDGKGWSVGGSTSSVADNWSRTGNEHLTENMYRYAAEMIFERYAWRCEIASRWQWVYTLEPARWIGGLPRTDGGTSPPCNPRYKSTVPPSGHHERVTGSSTTLSKAISVAGFTGSTTTTTGRSVYQYWKSQRNEQRYLCGSTRIITENTRVHSPA
ncbi:MAG: hypothetical protein ACRDY7_15300 [Acidimicrobiia bacterium]